VQAVWGNKFVPGLIDRYLASTGYDGQQYDGPEAPNRPHNLWAPAPGNQGAHGDFDERASDQCFQLWATTHRSWLALAGAGTMAAAWAASRVRS
jgi:hypothetical protein